jgi:hypothetical protein
MGCFSVRCSRHAGGQARRYAAAAGSSFPNLAFQKSVDLPKIVEQFPAKPG